ncbi:MAG: hypothetical protein AAFX93_19410 [Verrucomicrobiota bacterium]
MSEGALETIVKIAPSLEGLLERVRELESEKQLREDSEGVPIQKACELISGIPFGEDGCITTRKCMEMINRGLIKRVPARVIGIPVIVSRQSIRDYFAGLESEF